MCLINRNGFCFGARYLSIVVGETAVAYVYMMCNIFILGIIIIIGKLLAPETPSHNAACTIFNKQRLKKSTGTTLILESPDVKGNLSCILFTQFNKKIF